MFLSKRLLLFASSEDVLLEFNSAMQESGFGSVLSQFKDKDGISFTKIEENAEAFKSSLERLALNILDQFVSRQAGSQKGVFKENVKEAFVALLQDRKIRPLLGQETVAVLGFIVAALASKSGKGSESAMAKMLMLLHKQVPTAIQRMPASFYAKLLTELYDPSTIQQMKNEWFKILPKAYHDEILKQTQAEWSRRTKR